MKISLMICATLSAVVIPALVYPYPAEFWDKVTVPFAILCLAWLGLEIAPKIIKALIRNPDARGIAVSFVLCITLVAIMSMTADLSDKEIESIAYISVVVVLLGSTVAQRLLIRYFRKKAEKENGQNLEKV